MSAEIVARDEVWARRITERIRYSAIGVRDGLEKLQTLMAEAQDGNAHELLGYASWTAYISEVMGEEPLRLARDERRDLVAWLSGQGMSTRAIAPIVGVDQKTVSNDLRREEFSSPEPRPVADLFAKAPNPNETMADLPDTFEVDGMTVTRNGDVIDEPTVTEHTFTEKIKTVTGLDGKTYKRPEPKPVLTGNAAEQDSADTACREIGKALITLESFDTPQHRERVRTHWWPMGRDNIQPMHAALFTAPNIRRIAAALLKLADEMESNHA